MVFIELTGTWILTNGEPLKVSKTIHEMMEEYVYLAASNKKSAIRLISIPSRAVEDTSLYFDLPEAFEEDNSSSVSFSDVYIMKIIISVLFKNISIYATSCVKLFWAHGLLYFYFTSRARIHHTYCEVHAYMTVSTMAVDVRCVANGNSEMESSI